MSLFGAPIPANVKVNDIYEVEVQFRDTVSSKYLIPKNEITRFVKATIALHYNPGVNPANGNQTAKCYSISMAPLVFKGPFWWTTPDLERNDDPAGAVIIEGGNREILWEDREYILQLCANEPD